MNVVVLNALVAAVLLGVSLWRYKRHVGKSSARSGWVLWVLWVVYGVLSLTILGASGKGTMVIGGVVTWAFCVTGTTLGSRLLARADRRREPTYSAMATLFALVSGLLVFVLVWSDFSGSMLSTS